MMRKIKNDLKIKGYTVLKSFFSKKAIKKMLESYELNIDFCNKLANIKNSKNLDQKYLLLKKKNKKLKSRSYDISKFHPSIYQFATDKKLITILNNIFDEVFFLDYPQIRADDFYNSHALPMHQEIYGQMSTKLLTLWCPLTRVSRKEGTLKIIEGSHKEGLLKHEFRLVKSNKYHSVQKENIKKKKIKYLSLNPGDAVLFDPYLIHGTGNNTSKKVRWTFVARYNAISGIKYLKNMKSTFRIEQN
jgi:ectoine hydroxylase-related dioxygenase (phytanoyl-CoA dioxygenase family)